MLSLPLPSPFPKSPSIPIRQKVLSHFLPTADSRWDITDLCSNWDDWNENTWKYELDRIIFFFIVQSFGICSSSCLTSKDEKPWAKITNGQMDATIHTVFSFSLLFIKSYVQKGVLLHVVQNFMKWQPKDSFIRFMLHWCKWLQNARPIKNM